MKIVISLFLVILIASVLVYVNLNSEDTDTHPSITFTQKQKDSNSRNDMSKKDTSISINNTPQPVIKQASPNNKASSKEIENFERKNKKLQEELADVEELKKELEELKKKKQPSVSYGHQDIDKIAKKLELNEWETAELKKLNSQYEEKQSTRELNFNKNLDSLTAEEKEQRSKELSDLFESNRKIYDNQIKSLLGDEKAKLFNKMRPSNEITTVENFR